MEVDTGPVWTANFDDIPMDTGTSTAPATSPNNPAASSPLASPSSSTEDLPETSWSSPPPATSNAETGWADFSNFTPVSPKDPLRCNSPVAMETSLETMDPLGVNAPTQSEGEMCAGISSLPENELAF
ncbi:serine/threonine-protein phosphatase 6 regulatory subunit 3-A-like [Notothenia coriiceps]|uniref:Serine/threonine-protein phosphatase 6 regulatory subunit 3-A-like n=1 Tax=Notothenia coriiceps TaxID=8208 RepID=A0A6I9N122_9TELE|nr:PREDICTED: serine/threonine-protein phosphatase 6 regulatory subunit 3-A-like [Notothenia coriiceps]